MTDDDIEPSLLKRYQTYQAKISSDVRATIEKIYEDLCIDAPNLTTSKSKGGGLLKWGKVEGIQAHTLVSWLKNKRDNSETDALTCAQHLIDGGYLASIFPTSTHRFDPADPSTMYQVIRSDSLRMAGLVRREEGRKQGLLHLSSLLSWKAVHALVTSQSLALYESEDATAPIHLVALAKAKVHDVPSNPLSLKIQSSESCSTTIQVLTMTEEVKQAWIEALVGAGAQYFEMNQWGGAAGDGDSSSRVNGFFDLKDRWMNGQEAPMAQYRGKVCLIVNVASF